MKKKAKPKIPQYKLASFRKKRHKSVKSEIDKLRSLLLKGNLDTSKKKLFKERLRYITYFDKKLYRQFLTKYCKFVSLSLNVEIEDSLDNFLSVFEKNVMNEGIKQSLKIYKDLYTIACRIVTSNTYTITEFQKVRSDGIPRKLGMLSHLLKGTVNQRRAALAIVSVLKLIDYPSDDYSLETIEKVTPIPMERDAFPRVGNYFERYITKFGDSINGVDLNQLRRSYILTLEKMFPNQNTKKRLDDISKMSDIYYSARSGPNGPSLTTAVVDHCSLYWGGTEDEKLLDNIKAICTMTKNRDLQILLDNYEEEGYTVSHINKAKAIHSKLSLKNESWGRARVFAICDYFSQSVLKGFHKHLFKWLEAQQEDGTFKQEYCSEEVRKWTDGSQEKSCESADLSAATDSIPVEVQGEIIEQIAGRDFAKLWISVASDRNFKTPDERNIKYTAGQPMGLLSSWAMLAVWHHVMLRTCQTYLGISWDSTNPQFFVIGDDVAMLGEDMFHIYETLVHTMQGVGISKSKGFHKETQTNNNPFTNENCDKMITAELAKRIFCNGHEMTVIPPDEVLTSLENASQFPELLKSLQGRKYSGFVKDKGVPILTSLSRDKKLALLLSTNPIGETPLFTVADLENLAGQTPYSSLPWCKPGFDVEIFKEIFIKELKGTIIATLARVTGSISKWMETAATDGEVKVKDWRYTSETQGVLLYITADKCKEALNRILSEENMREAFPDDGPANWRVIKKYISSFQNIFEIDLALNPETKKKKRTSDRIRFSGTFVASVVKKAIFTMAQKHVK